MKTDPATKRKIENLNMEFLTDLHENSPGLFGVVKRAVRRSKIANKRNKNDIGVFGHFKLNSANSNDKAKRDAEQFDIRMRSQSNANTSKKIHGNNRKVGSSNQISNIYFGSSDSNENTIDDSLVSFDVPQRGQLSGGSSQNKNASTISFNDLLNCKFNGDSSQDQNDSGVSFDVVSDINDLLEGVSSQNDNTPSTSYSNQNTGKAEHDFMQYLNIPKLKQKTPKKNSVRTANQILNDASFDFFDGNFGKNSSDKNNYDSSYNLNSNKQPRTSDCLVYDVSTKELGFGTFPVSQQGSYRKRSKKKLFNTKGSNRTDAQKFLQHFSEQELPSSSGNEARENLKFLQLLDGADEPASNNRPINNFDLPFATEIVGSLDQPSADQNNFSELEFPSILDNVQPSRKVDFAQFLNGENGHSAPSGNLDESLDLELKEVSALIDEILQPTVNHNDQQENDELVNNFDRNIRSSRFNDQVDLTSVNRNGQQDINEPEHNYEQYLNTNRE